MISVASAIYVDMGTAFYLSSFISVSFALFFPALH